MTTLENKRLAILSSFSQGLKEGGIGKTAMMKFIYLLQEVYGVSLQYDFEIYTYGPYSSEVMGDIDFASHNEIISLEVYQYPSGRGYLLKPAKEAKKAVQTEHAFIEKNKESIDAIITHFGKRTAKDLELITTIIYLYKQCLKNSWSTSISDLSSDVQEIKPHFGIDEIKEEYRALESLQIFSLVS